MGGYLDALDRHTAWQHASSAAQLQQTGANHQDIMQALAAAETAAPPADRALQAARLDAYASAHGLKGWYRHTSRHGGGSHLVQVNKLRTPQDGDRGRYYASPAAGGASVHVIDRDNGNIAARAPHADAARDWISNAETRSTPAPPPRTPTSWNNPASRRSPHTQRAPPGPRPPAQPGPG